MTPNSWKKLATILTDEAKIRGLVIFCDRSKDANLYMAHKTPKPMTRTIGKIAPWPSPHAKHSMLAFE